MNYSHNFNTKNVKLIASTLHRPRHHFIKFADFALFLRLLVDSGTSKQTVQTKGLLLESANDFGISNVDQAAVDEQKG